jgi:hypothetical protein|tara:strand:+ start:862 stop:1152 length:291 start_codon:yes stop_codon:yes gene_type:complete
MNDPYSPGYIPDPYQSTGVKFKLNMPKTQKKKIQKKVTQVVNPLPKVSEQFYTIVEKSRAVDKRIKEAGEKPSYEDLKKFHDYSVEMEKSAKEQHL